MVLSFPSTWPERSLAFLKASLQSFRQLPSQDVLNQCVHLAGQLTGANGAFLVAAIDPVSIQIIAASEPVHVNKFLRTQFYYTHLHAVTIQLKNLSQIHRSAEAIFASSTYLLTIPVQEENFTGSVLLGYLDKPADVESLTEFAETVQVVFLEMMHLQLLATSLQRSRMRFNTLLHSVPEGMVLIDENGREAWVNHSAAGLLSLTQGVNTPAQVASAMAQLRRKADNAEKLEVEMRQILLSREKKIDDWPWYFTDPLPHLLYVSCAPINWGTTKGRIWTFQDATHKLESQKAKDRIQELSSLLTSILESSLSGIIAFKTIHNQQREIEDFEYLLANQTAKRILETGAEELTGKRLSKVFPDNPIKSLINQYIIVIETGEPLNLEHSFERKGEREWLHIVAVKLNDGLVVTFSDITKRKQAEEKLWQSQANIEAVIETTRDIIWSLDTNYTITTINSSFREKVLYQTGKNLVTGEKFDLHIFPQEAVGQWQKYFDRVFGGERFSEEVTVSIGNEKCFFDFSFNPIKDTHGNVTGIAIFGHDITRRKTTEYEIRQKSQMLNSILENMPVILFRLDAKGYFTESIGVGLKRLQLTDNQMVGMRIFEFYQEFIHQIRRVPEGNSYTFTSQGIADGHQWYLENYLFPDETNPGGLIGFALDITERKRIEQELKDAKDHADKASQSKSRFLANMSHEIRTPINAILGFAQVLKREDLSAEAIEYLNYISSSGEILLKLIGDVLDLTKIEEGKFELQEEAFHLREVFTSNLSPYRFRVQEKGLAFEIFFADDLPDYVIGDAGKLSQIVINLIGNALKFTKQGGIRVSFSTERTEAANQNILLKVSVSDTGIGIAAEKLGLIFQSFTQADSSTNREYGGSGLGLTIVKEIVERMGGQLGVESKTNQEVTSATITADSGSTFWFTIPLQIAQVSTLPSEKNHKLLEEIDYKGSVHVLLVDDNELNQRLASVMLKNMGCEVSIAGDGKEAIGKVNHKNFQLILMDIQMPVLNGYEATEYIREKLKLTTPIIGLSANVYKEEIDLCYASGMNDYLSKPYTEKSLREKILKWIPVYIEKERSAVEEKPEKAGRLTNLDFLVQLFNGDKQSIEEMVADFISQQQQQISEMATALEAKEYQKLSAVAHNMRSSIVTVGLDALRQPLLDLEGLVKRGASHSLLEEKFTQIKAINLAAIEELQSNQ